MISEKQRSYKIRKQYYRMVTSLTAALMILSFVAGTYTVIQQRKLNEERVRVTQKFRAVENLEESLTQVLLRARGYYAFQDKWELEQIDVSLEQFKVDLEVFERLKLTKEEAKLQKDLESFYVKYSGEILPIAISYVQNNDYESLRKLSSGGTNDNINKFLSYTKKFKTQARIHLDDNYEKALKMSNRFKTITATTGILSILIIIIAVERLLKGIVSPIEELSNTTKAVARGERMYLTDVYPQNEIGLLATSFQEMLKKIHEKEEELTEQNEELIAQQDELQNQQEKLRDYLTEIENINKALNQSAILCITDANGIITSVNDMFCKVTKYKREELIGKTTRVLKSDFHQDDFYKKMWDTITRGKIWQNELKNIKKDETFFWINATIVPYVNTDGRPYQYILIGIDITETKEIQEKLKDILDVTNSTKDKIEKHSRLNQNLTMTLDKEKFLDIVFNYFNEVYDFDKGVLIHTLDKYRSKGLSKEKLEELLREENMKDIYVRLRAEKSFVVKRESGVNESGIAEETTYCYDFYSSILNTDGTVRGVLAMTRIGIPFKEKEVDEINGLMKQLSVALSRIAMYEEIENTKNLNENIIENVNEGLQLVSLEGEMLQYNQILINLLELDNYTLKHKVEKEKWIDDFIVNCEEKDRLKAFLEQSIDPFSRESSSIRYAMNGKKKRFIQLYASAVLMHEKKIGTIFVYRDITKEYEVDKMKSELVSTVSHELRTPLASVLGFTEMLLMKELKPERQKKYLETIYTEGKRLTNLINDFLDLQRMESGRQKYTMELNFLNEIAMEAIEKFKHEDTHNIYLMDEAPFVGAKVDRDRMTQVFSNLISNGIKFSPEGRSIVIHLRNHENKLVISVKDDGIGIPDEDLPSIFEKFKRIDNSETRKIGGTGLGLAICKEIIEAHEGEIWIESEIGKGTTVSFAIPFYQEDDKEYETVFDQDNIYQIDKEKANVMLVEDDISLALLLSESLKSSGFTVLHYTNPKSALKDAKMVPLVGIVIDLMLGDEMDGWDLIEELKEDEKTDNISIIISSAIEKSEENIKKYKIYDYLVKPYSPDKLAKKLIDLKKSQEIVEDVERDEKDE